MNSLFNSALKQSSSVRRDLDAFADAPATSSAALQGQIAASLTSLSRTLDEYADLAKKELIPAKQEKAQERVKTFRADLLDYRQSFERLRKDREESQTSVNRTELLGRRPHHTSTPENPYAQSQLPASSPFALAPSRSTSNAPLSFGASPADYTRETHALREQNFMSSTNAQLDEYLERGRAVLGDLGQQREILKGTQRKLYSVANTLGVSGDTIRMVERRAKQDNYEKTPSVASMNAGVMFMILKKQIFYGSSYYKQAEIEKLAKKNSELLKELGEIRKDLADLKKERGKPLEAGG